MSENFTVNTFFEKIAKGLLRSEEGVEYLHNHRTANKQLINFGTWKLLQNGWDNKSCQQLPEMVKNWFQTMVNKDRAVFIQGNDKQSGVTFVHSAINRVVEHLGSRSDPSVVTLVSSIKEAHETLHRLYQATAILSNVLVLKLHFNMSMKGDMFKLVGASVHVLEGDSTMPVLDNKVSSGVLKFEGREVLYNMMDLWNYLKSMDFTQPFDPDQHSKFIQLCELYSTPEEPLTPEVVHQAIKKAFIVEDLNIGRNTLFKLANRHIRHTIISKLNEQLCGGIDLNNVKTLSFFQYPFFQEPCQSLKGLLINRVVSAYTTPALEHTHPSFKEAIGNIPDMFYPNGKASESILVQCLARINDKLVLPRPENLNFIGEGKIVEPLGNGFSLTHCGHKKIWYDLRTMQKANKIQLPVGLDSILSQLNTGLDPKYKDITAFTTEFEKLKFADTDKDFIINISCDAIGEMKTIANKSIMIPIMDIATKRFEVKMTHLDFTDTLSNLCKDDRQSINKKQSCQAILELAGIDKQFYSVGDYSVFITKDQMQVLKQKNAMMNSTHGSNRILSPISLLNIDLSTQSTPYATPTKDRTLYLNDPQTPSSSNISTRLDLNNLNQQLQRNAESAQAQDNPLTQRPPTTTTTTTTTSKATNKYVLPLPVSSPIKVPKRDFNVPVPEFDLTEPLSFTVAKIGNGKTIFDGIYLSALYQHHDLLLFVLNDIFLKKEQVDANGRPLVASGAATSGAAKGDGKTNVFELYVTDLEQYLLFYLFILERTKELNQMMEKLIMGLTSCLRTYQSPNHPINKVLYKSRIGEALLIYYNHLLTNMPNQVRFINVLSEFFVEASSNLPFVDWISKCHRQRVLLYSLLNVKLLGREFDRSTRNLFSTLANITRSEQVVKLLIQDSIKDRDSHNPNGPIPTTAEIVDKFAKDEMTLVHILSFAGKVVVNNDGAKMLIDSGLISKVVKVLVLRSSVLTSSFAQFVNACNQNCDMAEPIGQQLSGVLPIMFYILLQKENDNNIHQAIYKAVKEMWSTTVVAMDFTIDLLPEALKTTLDQSKAMQNREVNFISQLQQWRTNVTDPVKKVIMTKCLRDMNKRGINL
ncbi:hypothetical protein SAMD00019534_016720 [Acytostelium subglobosum LB1]|uniref:hypothetical protein n=1 Tax=Acytostelium subglobosum LB1 TaxID=1410327 RepID=UPI000644F830|nr:hypothetical protein SAMD00019534_016720 [Acytostelium subglobosum LB1]GAM18497.1 hypothetical protein SAMD00019534_016720 [Acytostelium subglobosum LB1]|eukprot:XP_012757717.1 hypothetical protein SAMD00019534_016720 [Acytostelium subglobosum LB1]